MTHRTDQPALVSVVTPCYNAAAFVGETLASVRSQTYAPLEHIVVDDGSTDGSWEVICGHREHVQAVRLEHNGGGSHARNVGAGLARGEFLMFLDADDLLTSDTLAALVEAVRERPGTIGICPWQRLRQGQEGAWRPAPAEVPLPAAGADHFGQWLVGASWVPPCAVLWRRDVYLRTGGWDEALTLNDDADLMMRALLDGVTPTLAAGGEAYYRHHGTSRLSVSGNVFSSTKIRSLIRIADKLAALLEANGKLAEYAIPLGTAYQQIALVAFQQGFMALGRECQAHGEQLAGGPRPISRTLAGRALCRLLGVELKESLVQVLAAWGIGTRDRREHMRSRARIAMLSEGSPDE